ncbi:MAG: 7-cyano-7-deazaguanine synthase QueC [Thermoleophilia bacterium]
MRHFVLLSGGLDSTTLLAWVAGRHPDEEISTVTFAYGQKHAVEAQAARRVADRYGVPNTLVELPHIRGSALTDADRALPQGRDLAQVEGIAPSYVPARNLLFLAALASLADAEGPAVLWLGVHRDDYTGYPDCRPEFVQAAGEAVRLGTRYGLRVEAPFVEWSKKDILEWGLAHEVPYELTHSCYQGEQPACGVCDTCQARLAAFAELGARDPLAYRRAAHGSALDEPCSFEEQH